MNLATSAILLLQSSPQMEQVPEVIGRNAMRCDPATTGQTRISIAVTAACGGRQSGLTEAVKDASGRIKVSRERGGDGGDVQGRAGCGGSGGGEAEWHRDHYRCLHNKTPCSISPLLLISTAPHLPCSSSPLPLISPGAVVARLNGTEVTSAAGDVNATGVISLAVFHPTSHSTDCSIFHFPRCLPVSPTSHCPAFPAAFPPAVYHPSLLHHPPLAGRSGSDYNIRYGASIRLTAPGAPLSIAISTGAAGSADGGAALLEFSASEAAWANMTWNGTRRDSRGRRHAAPIPKYFGFFRPAARTGYVYGFSGVWYNVTQYSNADGQSYFEVANLLLANPSGYFGIVKTAVFADGAGRGQFANFTRPTPNTFWQRS
ncbi:unnamed protein product [Closterium sp. NIES-65]|nr:unnamed protein product [Closterium sp. NIES-65]CAI5979184.1 unnamed protein product [Closterium sp. NIES-65]